MCEIKIYVNNMEIDNIVYIVCIIVILALMFIFFKTRTNLNGVDKPYYAVNEIEHKLNNIMKIKYDVLDEVNNINKKSDKWNNWPEKYLYEQGDWKIFPFYAFNYWVEDNCNLCPQITNFLKSIPNLKLATLSKMSGGTKLTPHQGWANHSNNVLRCHYGIIVPDNCSISVLDKNNWLKMYHNQFEWIIFDDAKMHYAENIGDKDRIVLIIDIERPKNIKIGQSTIGDTEELMQIVKYFKNNIGKNNYSHNN
jgi:aspartyl/asparaginyl beta-hydroxylase (cupin superfamily)